MTDTTEIPTTDLTALHHRIGTLEGAASVAAHLLANAHKLDETELLQAAKTLERVANPAHVVDEPPMTEARRALRQLAETLAQGRASEPEPEPIDHDHVGRVALTKLHDAQAGDTDHWTPADDISGSLGVPPADALLAIRNLEDDGYVEKHPIEGSRWKFNLRLTDAGREHLNGDPDA